MAWLDVPESVAGDKRTTYISIVFYNAQRDVCLIEKLGDSKWRVPPKGFLCNVCGVLDHFIRA